MVMILLIYVHTYRVCRKKRLGKEDPPPHAQITSEFFVSLFGFSFCRKIFCITVL